MATGNIESYIKSKLDLESIELLDAPADYAERTPHGKEGYYCGFTYRQVQLPDGTEINVRLRQYKLKYKDVFQYSASFKLCGCIFSVIID